MAKRTMSRLYSLDVVRGLAIFAMVIAHTAFFIRPAPVWVTYPEGLLNSVAAPLFALIIGVTITVTGNGIDTPRAERAPYRLQTTIKALALIALAFVLSLTLSGVNVVLDFLGVTLLVALPFLYLRTKWLLYWAASLLLVSPAVIIWVRGVAAVTPELVYPQTILTQLLDWFVLGRSYQVLILLAMLLLGIALARTAMSKKRALLLMFWFSSAAFCMIEAANVFVLDATRVRGDYIEVFRELALTLAAFSFIMYLLDHASATTRRFSRIITAPLAVQGRMALSIYVLHVGILMCIHAFRISPDTPQWLWEHPLTGWIIQIGLVVACWAFAAGWWRLFGAGPIERVIRFLSGRIKRQPVSV